MTHLDCGFGHHITRRAPCCSTFDVLNSSCDSTFGVLSMDGIAASFTNMAVPPLGSAKQLWLRNGRAYAPDYHELVRLLVCHESILFPLSVDSGLSPRDVNSIVGGMLSIQLAEAVAHRASLSAKHDFALRSR